MNNFENMPTWCRAVVEYSKHSPMTSSHKSVNPKEKSLHIDYTVFMLKK